MACQRAGLGEPHDLCAPGLRDLHDDRRRAITGWVAPVRLVLPDAQFHESGQHGLPWLHRQVSSPQELPVENVLQDRHRHLVAGHLVVGLEPFEEGLRRTIDWYRTNEWWWRPIKEQDPAFKAYYERQYQQRQ